MSYAVGPMPVYLLGNDAAPVTSNGAGAWVTLSGSEVYRSVIVEGVPGGATVTITASNSNRPSNSIAVTGPDGNPLVISAAEMLTGVGLPGAPMQLQATVASASGSTSLRCYLI